jgi:hypothetical protein
MNRAYCDTYRLDNENLTEHVVNVICNTECNIVSHSIQCRVRKYDVMFSKLESEILNEGRSYNSVHSGNLFVICNFAMAEIFTY